MALIQAEQEEIIRNRPSDQKGLTLKEIRKMDYVNKVTFKIQSSLLEPSSYDQSDDKSMLSQVIDETLRVVSFSLMVFREAKKDVSVCGNQTIHLSLRKIFAKKPRKNN